MKKIIMFLAVSAALLVSVHAGTEPVNVVTTTSDLKSLVESIGGIEVSVKSICDGYQDPHFAQAKPVYMTWARNADVWVSVGLDLEVGYEGAIIDGSRNNKIKSGEPGRIDASEGVLVLEVPQKAVDRSMGDVHPFGNPHYWLDPFNGRVMAKTIASRLQKMRPDKTELFKANLSRFLDEVDEAMFGEQLFKKYGGEKLWDLEVSAKLDEFLASENAKLPEASQEKLVLKGWAGRLRPFKGEKVITFHRSWSYFMNRFGLTISGELEPMPGIPPSPKHLVELAKTIRSEKIRLLIMEPFYSRQAPDYLNENTGIDVVEASISVTGQGAERDYVRLIGSVVDKVASVYERPH